MGIVALIGLLVGVGFSLPPHQTIRRTAVYDRPYDEVWKVLADFPGRAAWREEVQRVQALPDRNGNQVWRVLGNDYEQTLEITSYSPGRHLVVAFTDERHTFTGARAFDIRAEGKQTRITLTESGEIESAILRLACRDRKSVV